MAFVAGSLPGVDGAKCVKMALVHDIAEAIVGDITPHDPVTPAEKHAREAAAVEKMQVMLGPAVWATAGANAPGGCWLSPRRLTRRCAVASGAEMLSLWEECVRGTRRGEREQLLTWHEGCFWQRQV